MLLFLIQAAELRRSAHSCLLSRRDLFNRIAQKFDETLDSQFPVGSLAAGLLGYDAKDAILADAAANAAYNKFFLLRGETGGVCHIEPERHARAHLVDILAAWSAAKGCGEPEFILGQSNLICYVNIHACTIIGKKFASPSVSLFLKEPYLPVIEIIFGGYYLYLSRIDKRPDYR